MTTIDSHPESSRREHICIDERFGREDDILYHWSGEQTSACHWTIRQRVISCPCFVLRISHDIDIIMSLDVISDLTITSL